MSEVSEGGGWGPSETKPRLAGVGGSPVAVGLAGRLLIQSLYVPAARALDGLGHRVPGLTQGASLHPGDAQVRLEEEVEPAVGEQQGDLQDAERGRRTQLLYTRNTQSK